MARELIPFAVRAGWLRWRQGCHALVQSIPAACPLCGRRTQGGRLCALCHGFVTASMREHLHRCPHCALLLQAHNPCPDCSVQAFAFTRVVAAFDYQHPGDLLIRQFKLQKRFGMAPRLAVLLQQAVSQSVPVLDRPDVVVPVPAHAFSLRERGFSPARELTTQFCRLQRWQADYRLLRSRATVVTPQKHLGRRARAQQAQSLYYCTRNVPGATVLVVDDVMTTGSTLHAAAQALLEAGAAQVACLVLARTPSQVRHVI